MKKIYMKAAAVIMGMELQKQKGWDLTWKGPGTRADLVSPATKKFLKRLGLIGRAERHGDYSRFYFTTIGRRLLQLTSPDTHLVSAEDWAEALERIDRYQKAGPYPELAQYGPTAIGLMRDAWMASLVNPYNPWRPETARVALLLSDMWLLHDRGFIQFCPIGGFRITPEGCYRYGFWVGQQSMITVVPPDPKPGGPQDYSLSA